MSWIVEWSVDEGAIRARRSLACQRPMSMVNAITADFSPNIAHVEVAVEKQKKKPWPHLLIGTERLLGTYRGLHNVSLSPATERVVPRVEL